MKTARGKTDRSRFKRPAQLRELFDGACTDELAEAIGVLAHMRATRAGLSDLEAVSVERRRLELIAEFHRLNVRCLERLGHPILTHADLDAVANADAPTSATFARWFGSLERARYEARLLEVPYPEALSTLPTNRVPDHVQLTDEECELAFATMIDELGGVLPTEMQVHVMRAGKDPRTSPGVNRLISVDGKRTSLDNAHVRAVERICAAPDRFPRAYRVWGRVPAAQREQVVRGRRPA